MDRNAAYSDLAATRTRRPVWQGEKIMMERWDGVELATPTRAKRFISVQFDDAAHSTTFIDSTKKKVCFFEY